MADMEFVEILKRDADEKPYYEIHYIKNGEHHIGYSSFSLKIVSEYLREFFIKGGKPHIEELKAAVALIHAECDLNGRCSECPLNKSVCHQFAYPATWQADKIGVENDVNICDNM